MKKSFKIKFAGVSYNALYITEQVQADKILKELLSREAGIVYGLDFETYAEDEFLSIDKAATVPAYSHIRLCQIFTGKASLVFDLKKLEDTTLLKEFLAKNKFVAHNGIFELMFLAKDLKLFDIDVDCTLIMTRLIYHTLYPTKKDGSLDAIVKTLFKETLSKDAQKSNWGLELTFDQVQYAALDAVAAYKVYEKLVPFLAKLKLKRIYELMKRVQYPVAQMQLTGFNLDTEAHRSYINTCVTKLLKAKQEVAEYTGLKTFTPKKFSVWLENNLPKDVLAVWPRGKPNKHNPKGQLKTDADTFADFSHLEFVAPISNYKKLDTITTKFGNTLTVFVNKKTKRIHSRYFISGAKTGRFSCSRPNSQQYPRDKGFRSLFVAKPGNKIIVADFSQVEVRIAAELSGEPALIKAFRDGVDIYAHTASLIIKKPISKITAGERQIMKACVLGMQFGLGAAKLGHYAKKGYEVDISDDEAKSHVKLYRKTYPIYRKWQLRQVEKAAENNYIAETLLGKKRKLDPAKAFGNAMNMPVQGTAAEVMMLSLCYIYEKITTIRKYCRIVASVHDEIVIECKEEYAKKVSKLLEKAMLQAYIDIIPNAKCTNNLVDASIGDNWAEAK